MLSNTFLSAASLSLLLGATASPVVKRDTNLTPVITKDFPDPSVIKAADGNWYAYATAGNGVNIQVARSTEALPWNDPDGSGSGWELLEGHDALHSEGVSWAPAGQIWAPDVTNGPDGTYWMYFAGLASETGEKDHQKHCIGFAFATDPLGPFIAQSSPWVCDHDTGDIDADQFLDEDGSRWVTWKVDGNSVEGATSTPIMLQEVDRTDGVTKVGDAIKILDRDDADGPLVEAPSLVKSNGVYFLTFSSNWYNTDKYDTSYATATSVKGPYTKAQAPGAPLLTTGNTGISGPGGADMWYAPADMQGTGLMVYHGWNQSDIKNHAVRYMYAAGVSYDDKSISLF